MIFIGIIISHHNCLNLCFRFNYFNTSMFSTIFVCINVSDHKYLNQYFESWSFESFNNCKIYSIRDINGWSDNKVTLIAFKSILICFVFNHACSSTRFQILFEKHEWINFWIFNVRSVCFRVTRIENDKHIGNLQDMLML